MHPLAQRIRYLGLLVLLVSAVLASTAVAGNNSGTTATLSWVNNGVVTNTASGPSNNLYVRLSRATAMDFKGAEIDLIWSPERSPDDLGCFEKLGTFFQTSSSCSTSGYLNRGTNLPVTVNDDPNHYHVAWANTSTSACTVGNAVRVQFETDLCGDYGRTGEGCFVLTLCDLLDSNNLVDHSTIVGSTATVDNGGSFCASNSPPVVEAIPDQSVDVLTQLVVTPSASDPDGDSLTWLGANIPSGATVDPSTGVLTWTPSLLQAGVYPGVTLIALDTSSASDSASFTITVHGLANSPPVIAPIPDQSVAAGQLLSFTVSASDSNGDFITYSSGPLPSGASFVGQLFSWTPTVAQVGGYDVQFFAADIYGATDTAQVHIDVTQPVTVVYVDQASGCSVCDGTSWATAVHTITEGLALAPAGAHASVLVAQGIYPEMLLTPSQTTQLIGGYQTGGLAWDPLVYVTTIRAPATQSSELVKLTADSVRVEGFTVTGVNKGRGPVYVVGHGSILRSLTVTKNRVGSGDAAVGVFNPGDALIDRCIIARNLAGAPSSGRGSLTVGTGARGTIEDCTLTLDSTKTVGWTAGLYVQGGTVTVRNTILYGLRPVAPPILVDNGGSVDVTYSDVQGGWTGIGNISADPLICGAKAGNFTLSAASPCIGAGHDGTTIGALESGCAKPSDDEEQASGLTVPEVEDTPTSLALDVRPTLVRGRTDIRFALPQESRVKVEVFDAAGVRVSTLVNEALPAGLHVATWDAAARAIASGSYVVRLSTEGGTLTRSILVLR